HVEAIEGIGLVVVLQIHVDACPDLFHVGETGGPARLVTRLREHREENGCQDGDNGNHHEQLDKRKADAPTFFSHWSPYPGRSIALLLHDTSSLARLDAFGGALSSQPYQRWGTARHGRSCYSWQPVYLPCLVGPRLLMFGFGPSLSFHASHGCSVW